YASDRAVVSTLGQALDLAADFEPEVVGAAVDTFHIWWDPDVAAQIDRAGREGRIATYQVCDWATPLPADVLLSRHYPGDGVIDFAHLTRAVEETGTMATSKWRSSTPTSGTHRTPRWRGGSGKASAPPLVHIWAGKAPRIKRVNPTTASTPRLADVARLAGVSLATASRVLNGSTRKVAESYQRRVLEAAEELGYTANLSAQATARGTAGIIALLVADIADPYFSNIAAGVARMADEAGLVVTIATTNRDPAREAALLQTLRGQRPRAVILAASRSGEPIAEAASHLSASGSTVVALGHDDDPDVRWLGVDNHGGARLLGTEMAGLGYRRAIILAAGEGIRTSDDRIAGFSEGFTSGGGREPIVRRTGFDREGGKEAMADLIAEGYVSNAGAPTLVFAIS